MITPESHDKHEQNCQNLTTNMKKLPTTKSKFIKFIMLLNIILLNSFSFPSTECQLVKKNASYLYNYI